MKESFLPRAPSSKNLQLGLYLFFYIVRLTVERRMFAQTNVFLQITKTTCILYASGFCFIGYQPIADPFEFCALGSVQLSVIRSNFLPPEV